MLFAFACKTKSVHSSDLYSEELEGLTSDASKKAYLEQLFSDDQKVRGGDGEIMVKYGKDSPEYSSYIKRKLHQDL